MKRLGDTSIKTELGGLLVGRVCILGVGNRMRGDDGAGPRVIDGRRPGTRGVWFDAGMAPENYLEPIARTDPDTVLIIDAVVFGGVPGQLCLIDVRSADSMVLSTHASSMATLSEYLSARTGANVHLLGIETESIETRVGLSPSVERSVDELAALLSDLLAAQA